MQTLETWHDTFFETTDAASMNVVERAKRPPESFTVHFVLLCVMTVVTAVSSYLAFWKFG
jgi:hypothetical protein